MKPSHTLIHAESEHRWNWTDFRALVRYLKIFTQSTYMYRTADLTATNNKIQYILRNAFF